MEFLAPYWTTFLSYYKYFDVDVGQQALWNDYRSLLPNDMWAYVIGLSLAHSVPFYLVNTIYLVLEKMCPDWLDNYRFQAPKKCSNAQLIWCIFYVTVWHCLAPFVAYFLWPYAQSYQPGVMMAAPPGILTIAWQMVVAYYITDFTFFCGHFLLHCDPFYIPIHKQHHSFYVSVGFAAEYAHPVEIVVGDTIPVIMGPVLLKYHPMVFILWMILAMVGTSIGHSGIKHPWQEPTQAGFHDFHHSHNKGCYGSMRHWDRFFGTDKEWQEFVLQRKQRLHDGKPVYYKAQIEEGKKKVKEEEGSVTPKATPRRRKQN